MNFANCMGGSIVLSNCYTLENLMTLEENRLEALLFSYLYRKLDFICGFGYKGKYTVIT